jgi:alkylated DNA repair dioxygenase AlkB
MQGDLFTPVPAPERFDLPDAELLLIRHWLEPARADSLLQQLHAELAWEQSVIRVYGRHCPIPRLNAWYADPGCDYGYSGVRMITHPWTPALQAVRQAVEVSCATGFNSVLANCYRDGVDSVGWHADDEPELGKNPVIASVSLGGSRCFQLRHRLRKDLGRLDIELTHGSLLIMRGETQHHWVHAIPKTRKICPPRINLTFRRVASKRG